jgi:radial spoke head protein 1
MLENCVQRRYQDALYIGVIIGGKRHGKGVMKYKNGRQYEGDWVADIRNGRGFERYPNSNYYTGYF